MPSQNLDLSWFISFMRSIVRGMELSRAFLQVCVLTKSSTWYLTAVFFFFFFLSEATGMKLFCRQLDLQQPALASQSSSLSFIHGITTGVF